MTTLPSVLYPAQQRWIADPSPFKIAEKARRTGITFAESADDVLIAAAAKRAGGQNVYYIGTDKDMTEEYIDACSAWAKQFNRVATDIGEGLWDEDKEDSHIKTYTIRFPESGHRITALASRPRKLRGRQGVLVGDEAAFQDDLAGLIKAAMAFLIWGGKVRLISTHDGEDNAFNQLIEEVRAGKRKGTVHRIAFRDAVKDGLYQRICLRLGKVWTPEDEEQFLKDTYDFYGDDTDEELDLIPSKGGGVYLSMGLVLSRMNKDTPIVRGAWKPDFAYQSEEVRWHTVNEWCIENLLPHLRALNPAQPHGIGGDYGRIGDLTAYPVLEEGKDLVRRVKLWVELSVCPYRQQEQIFDFIAQRLPRFRGAALDANGIGATLAEFARQKYGTLIEEVKLSESFYLENMPKFKADLEDGMLSDVPKDDEIRDDLRAIKKIGGVPKIPREKSQTKSADGKRKQRHGDGAVALFLANYALAKDSQEIDFAATGQRTLAEFDETPIYTDHGFGAVAGGNDFEGW
jgi:phage FluMu gp28-like protein